MDYRLISELIDMARAAREREWGEDSAENFMRYFFTTFIPAFLKMI